MFEFSIAAKYLTPRWRQLSVSIISIVSILVIAVAVWLIVVFFSVTNGLTSSWIDKLTALTAPVRITPTSHYYSSYYHLIDSISASSDYNLKTIGEKRGAELSNPYDDSFDEEVPRAWPMPDFNSDGTLKDPVKLAFSNINNLHQHIKGLSVDDYEITVGNLRLRLIRKNNQATSTSLADQNQNFLSQASYLGSLDPQNSKLFQALAPATPEDLSNILATLALKTTDSLEEAPNKVQLEDGKIVQERFTRFFSNLTVDKLKTPLAGWRLPRKFLPETASWEVLVIKKDGLIQRLLVPQKLNNIDNLRNSLIVSNDTSIEIGTLAIDKSSLKLKIGNNKTHLLSPNAPLYLEGGVSFSTQLIEDSLLAAKDSDDIQFHAELPVQNNVLAGKIFYKGLEIDHAEMQTLYSKAPSLPPPWIYATKTASTLPEFILPNIEGYGQGVMLPKSFRTSGALLGDIGYLSYYAPTTSSVQEQRIPIYVAGFYDPGIIPIGGKYILTSKEITTLIRSFFNHEEATTSNGINVRFDDINDTDRVKKILEEDFKKSGIAPYWKIETYREFEFTKDIIQQLQSEKRLFTLLATLIIIVACSNIISMLIILVNDKKLEIGILRSMGASAWSIATIFGFCGVVMGAIGSLLGILMALITLKNIQALVDFIGRVQGYEMFNPMFYGETLPTEISLEALTFVIIATAIISLVAGIIPAIKASLLRPSAILKAE